MGNAEVDCSRNVFCLMGLPVDAIGMDAAVECVRHAAFSNTRCFISTPNLNFAMAARKDAAFRDSVLHSDLSLPDGMPLVWVARLLGLPIRERVSGAGLFERLLQHAGPPVTVYFFGGLPGAAEAASQRLNKTNVGLKCVGFDAPGFGSVEELSGAVRIGAINRSGAQFVVVALGAKKGQAWIEYNRTRLQAPVLCHLGAVVNFAAGSVRRAPRWVQTVGAEWLWRIKEEPSLWRRYASDGASFAGTLVRHLLPLAVQLRWGTPTPEELLRASLSVLETPGQTTLELRGAWTHANLAPLRHALARAQERRLEVVLDLAAVTHVDSAFLGLALLVRGTVAAPRRWVIRRATAKVASVFNHSGVASLLAPSQGCE